MRDRRHHPLFPCGTQQRHSMCSAALSLNLFNSEHRCLRRYATLTIVP